MSQPPKPIACIACNTINFSATGPCKSCGEALAVLSKTAEAAPVQQEMTQEEAREILADEIAKADSETVSPETSGRPLPPSSKKASQPSAPVDRELARRKLQAKLQDARMNRQRLSEITEVRDAKGKRIRGARRVPITETRPMSTPTNPFEAM